MLFSASIIVIGTLFVYVFALEDDNMSRREQTMVGCCLSFSLEWFHRRMKLFIFHPWSWLMKEVVLIGVFFLLSF